VVGDKGSTLPLFVPTTGSAGLSWLPASCISEGWAARLSSEEGPSLRCRLRVFEQRNKADPCPALHPLPISSLVSSISGRASGSSMRIGHCADPGSDSVSPSSQFMSMIVGFSGDPSPNDVVVFPCPSLLPPSSSIVDQSKAGGGDRVGRGSMGTSCYSRKTWWEGSGNTTSGI
jgi:hypothetical protein